MDVTLEGYYKDQMFDQRELRFEVGEGESLDLPCGLEKAIQRMEKENIPLCTSSPAMLWQCWEGQVPDPTKC